MTLLKTQAIQNALGGDWKTAVALNEELVKTNPADIEALNRLAFAYSVLGRLKEAKTTYHKVLSLDVLNPIALRGLKRLENTSPHKPFYQSEDCSSQKSAASLMNSCFIEETGKTKVVELVNTAEPRRMAQLATGEWVTLNIKRLKIFVLGREKQYIGMLPDNIGKRLIKFMKGGNQYEAHVKSVFSNKIAVFIRETKRAQRFKNQPSFILSEKSYALFDRTIEYKRNGGQDLSDQEQKSSRSHEDVDSL